MLKPRGEGPGPRFGHVACLVGGNTTSSCIVVVYGGINSEGQCSGDLHLLNFDADACPTWTRIDAGLPPRFFRACVSVGTNQILMFGGRCESNDSCLGTLAEDAMVIHVDATAKQANCKEELTPTNIVCTVESRSDTAMVVHTEKGMLFLLGGLGSCEWYGDMHTLDIS